MGTQINPDLRRIGAWYIRFSETASMGITTSFSESKSELKMDAVENGSLGAMGEVGRS